MSRVKDTHSPSARVKAMIGQVLVVTATAGSQVIEARLLLEGVPISVALEWQTLFKARLVVRQLKEGKIIPFPWNVITRKLEVPLETFVYYSTSDVLSVQYCVERGRSGDSSMGRVTLTRSDALPVRLA